ncbi:hypothetical protein BDR03DRAFT_946640 [Suillus americanus]|nr:hypothetical protein BDR03DRAFT_946640 [Suillus americanus]
MRAQFSRSLLSLQLLPQLVGNLNDVFASRQSPVSQRLLAGALASVPRSDLLISEETLSSVSAFQEVRCASIVELIIYYDGDVESLGRRRPDCIAVYLDLDVSWSRQDRHDYKKWALCMEYHIPRIRGLAAGISNSVSPSD